MNHIEKTLVILKPDAVQRTLVGEIIQRFEKVGLKLVAMKMLEADVSMIEKHYLADPNWKTLTGERVKENMQNAGVDVSDKTSEELGNEVLCRLKRYMSAGPVIAFILEGANAIKLTRKIVGATEPLGSDVGTIRGDFVLDSYAMADEHGRSIRNLIHASSSSEDASIEMKIWFSEKEIVNYESVHEKVLYDIKFDNVV